MFSVLRVLELVSLRGLKNFDDWKTATLAELNNQGLAWYRKLVRVSSLHFCHRIRQFDYLLSHLPITVY